MVFRHTKIMGRWGEAEDLAEIRLDKSADALMGIDYAHHEIHEGNSFMAFFENMCTNIGEMSFVGFNTPNTARWCHLIFTGVVTALSRLAIYENPSLDVGGGGNFAVLNRDRNSSNVSSVSSIEAVPIAGRVTTFNEVQAAAANLTNTWPLAQVVVGTQQVKGVGGALGGREEIILAKNMQYAFMIESLTIDDNYHGIQLDWYEHTNRH